MSLIDEFLSGYEPGTWTLNPITPGGVYNAAILDVGDDTGLTWVCNARVDKHSSDVLFTFDVTPADDSDTPGIRNVYLSAPSAETAAILTITDKKVKSVYVALSVSDGTNTYPYFLGYIPIGPRGAL